jgi:hypothetical protein
MSHDICLDEGLRALRDDPVRTHVNVLATDDLVIDRDQARHLADDIARLTSALAEAKDALYKIEVARHSWLDVDLARSTLNRIKELTEEE